MKKTYCLWISLIVIVCSLNAQVKVNLKGIVQDSLEVPLVGASVMLMHEKDSLLEGFAITNSDGAFEILAENVDQYLLQITYVGYGTFGRKLSIQKDSEDIDFGVIVLRTDAYQLEGVEITESFIPIVIKKDTIEYNAAAFKTKPNAVVEDLLKKLPGVEVDKDGTIRAQGEEVQNILVDGKAFFDDDPKIASKNIPADLVNKVQVFDKASDFKAFTGIDDGNDEKTINLKIKEGKNKGLFGEIKGAYGTENRFSTSANLNRFTPKMQLSFLGNANNINEHTDLLNNSGITKALSSGVNFNYDFSEKTSLRSNYFANFSDNFTNSTDLFLNVLEDGIFTNESSSHSISQLLNQRAKLKLKHIINQKQDLSLELRLTHTDSESAIDQSTTSFLNELLPLNKSVVGRNSQVNDLYWKSELMYRLKLKKAGRFFTSKVTLSNQNNNNSQWLNNRLDINLFDQGIWARDTIQQNQNEEQDNQSYTFLKI